MIDDFSIKNILATLVFKEFPDHINTTKEKSTNPDVV